MRTKRITRQALLAGAAIALMSAAQAGEYKLIEGGQYELCRDLERNLNTFKDEPPMVCGIRINPDFEDFDVPDWEPMQAKDHVNLLKQLFWEQNIHKGGYTPKAVAKEWKKYKFVLAEKISLGTVHLWKAQFDIDHDGKMDAVIKVADDQCNPVDDFYWPTDPNLFVLVPNSNSLNPNFSSLRLFRFDAFLRTGRTYLTAWEGKSLDSEDATLYVFETFEVFGKLGFKQVCQYNYLQ